MYTLNGSSSQIYCCHARVALSKAYNYYQNFGNSLRPASNHRLPERDQIAFCRSLIFTGARRNPGCRPRPLSRYACLERESLLNLLRRTVNLRRPERARNERNYGRASDDCRRIDAACGLVCKAHSLLYHSTLNTQGPSGTSIERNQEEAASGTLNLAQDKARIRT